MTSEELFNWLDADIRNRQGLGNEWEHIDDETKEELKKKWIIKFEELSKTDIFESLFAGLY